MRVTEPYIIFPRKLTSGRIVYYFQYRDENGRRSTIRSTGETVLSKAKRVVQQLYNSGAFVKKDTDKTFGEYANDFFSKDGKYYKFQSAVGKPVKDSTLKSYSQLLQIEILPFFCEKKLALITRDTIKEWVVWASSFWSAKTINNAHGVLSIIFQSAFESELISRNPVSGVRFKPVEKKSRELLTIDEIRRIYDSRLWARESERKMFLLAAVTGMRIGEISALRKSDVHEGYLDVTKSYSDKFGEGSTKTGMNRKVPIVDGFDYGESHTEWLFEGITADKPLMSHAVYNCFSRICDKLNIDRKSRGITIHSLRNFFISYLQSENVPEPKIKAVVGHKDKSNMTDHYTYWTPDMLSEVYAVQLQLYRKITEAENEGNEGNCCQ